MAKVRFGAEADDYDLGEEELEELPEDDLEEDFPEVETQAEEPEPNVQTEPAQVRLRSFIPVDLETAQQEAVAILGKPLTNEQYRNLERIVAEDCDRGFRTLSTSEMKKYSISESPDDYRTMEALSKNYLKVSSTMGKDYFDKLVKFEFPPGYLIDDLGDYTPEAVYELVEYCEFVRKYRLPREADGSINFSRWKRGDLGKDSTVREENPRYKLRFSYWEEVAYRSTEWRRWRDNNRPDNRSEIKFGQLATIPTYIGGEPALLERIEEAEQRLAYSVNHLRDEVLKKILPSFRQAGMEIRAKGLEVMMEVVSDPFAGEEIEDIE